MLLKVFTQFIVKAKGQRVASKKYSRCVCACNWAGLANYEQCLLPLLPSYRLCVDKDMHNYV